MLAIFIFLRFWFILRGQLEDAEYARNTALKARQMIETDLAELTTTLEEIQKAKSDAEEKAALYAREKTQLQSQLDENEEELAEVRVCPTGKGTWKNAFAVLINFGVFRHVVQRF